MLDVGTISCAVFLLGAPADAATFPQIWYREVFLGEVGTAAEQYEALYSRPVAAPRAGASHRGDASGPVLPVGAPPWLDGADVFRVGAGDAGPEAEGGSLPDLRELELRLKAALRAGLCFERVGRPVDAALAYTWMLDQGPRAAAPRLRALTSEAALRLESLHALNPGSVPLHSGVGTSLPSAPPGAGSLAAGEASSLATGPADGLPGPVAAAVASASFVVRQRLQVLRDADQQLHETFLSLESELGIRKERLEERRGLVKRLAQQGVLVLFPSRDAGASALLQGPLGALGAPADPSRVLSSLLDRYLERVLLSLSSGNWSRARDDLRVVESLCRSNLGSASTASPTAERASGRAREYMMQPDRLGALAQRNFLDEDLARRAALRVEVRGAVQDAEALVGERGRVDLAVASLLKMRDLLDWTRPSLREDAEVRDLSARAERLLESLARSSSEGESFLRLWRGSRDRVDDILSLAEDLVTVLSQQSQLEGPALLEGRADALSVCRADVDRLIYRARDADERGDRVAAQRLVRDALTILSWVPAVDREGQYRVALDALRQGGAPSPDRTAPSPRSGALK